MRVLIAVTHLLGTGHLARALTLGKAFAAAGWHVCVVSGGRPVPHLNTDGVEFVQLPPVHVQGTDFSSLFGPTGPVTDAYMRRRQAALLETLDFAPDLLITELFPFGRRNLRTEFLALLEACAAPALCSIRDILAPPSKPSRAAWTEELVQTHYAGVLVHSDPDLVPLNHSWPVSDTLQARLHYTGFVAPAAPRPAARGHGDIIVSAGGGPVGLALAEAAKAAAALDNSRQWRCLIRGAALTDVPPNMHIEPPRADFRNLLMTAGASVSMCGYNTAMDILQTGVPAIVVPFDEGGEVEQGIRASALKSLSSFEVVAQSDLTGAALNHCLGTLGGRREPIREGMDGAAEAVRIAERVLNVA